MVRILADLWRTLRISIVRSWALATGAAVMQLGAAAVIYVFLHCTSTNHCPLPASWTHTAIHLQILVAAGLAGSAYLFGSVLGYLNESLCIRLMRRYETRCIHRLTERLRKTPTDTGSLLAALVESGTVHRFVNGDARIAGLCARLAVLASPAFLMLPAIVAFLWQFDALALAIVSPVLLAVVIASYRVSLSAMKAGDDFARMAPRAARRKRSVLADFMQENSHRAPMARIAYDPDVRAAAGAFESRIRVLTASRLVNGMGMAVAFAAVFAAVGTRIVSEGRPLADIIVYLVVVRLLFLAGQRIATLLTAVSRFRPHIVPFAAVLRAIDDADNNASLDLRAIAELAGQADAAFAVPRLGEPCGIIGEHRSPSRFCRAAIANNIALATGSPEVRVIGLHALDEIGADARQQLAASLDEMEAEYRMPLDQDARRCVMGILHAVRSNVEALLVELTDLRKVPPALRSRLLQALGDCRLLIYTPIREYNFAAIGVRNVLHLQGGILREGPAQVSEEIDSPDDGAIELLGTA